MAGDLNGDIDVEYATTIAYSAIRLMAKNSIPATPENFSVWFSYAKGASPALRKSIDILIGGKRKFDAVVNHDLFVTYIRQQCEPDPTSDFPERLHGVISSAKQFLAAAILNHTQIKALDEVSSQVRVNSDPRSIIERLVIELSIASARASALEVKFVSSSQDLESIRCSLKEAEARSNTDVLTGLANRRSLDDFLRSAQIVALRRVSLSAFY